MCAEYLNWNIVKPVYNNNSWDPSKVAVVRCSDVTYLEVIWDALGSGWSLLTCGHCLEVVVNTGLTVQSNLFTTASLGTSKLWPFCSIKLGLLPQRWPLGQV